jgi:hypothetical protein
MTLDKPSAKEMVETATKLYVNAQLEAEAAHGALKVAIRRASNEAGLTQQQIADATIVGSEEPEFSLSRQRISQIINE